MFVSPILASGVVTTLAGSGNAALADGASTVSSFNYPRGISVDTQGNLFVADTNNNVVRKIAGI